MASSKLAARAIRNHAKYKGRNDLNIVPMIDMMVILVFFLLFTAVFSNTNILELNLPAPNSSVPELQKGLELEVIVRKNNIEIADRDSGVLRSLPKKDGEYDYEGLSDYLQFVKSKYQTRDRGERAARAGHSVRRAGADHGQRAPVREGRRAGSPRSSCSRTSPWVMRRWSAPRLRAGDGRREPRNDPVSHQETSPARASRQPHGAGAVHRHADHARGVPAAAQLGRRNPAEHQEHHHSAVDRRPQAARDRGHHGHDAGHPGERPRGREDRRPARPTTRSSSSKRLRAELKEQNDTSTRLAAQEDLAEREITIMGDKGTPFSVLKRVMATATAADYGKVSLAVIQREREVGAGA